MNGKKQDGAAPSMEQAKALAGSPAARELMALLRQKGGDELQNAGRYGISKAGAVAAAVLPGGSAAFETAGEVKHGRTAG